jgi:hypothetical protein
VSTLVIKADTAGFESSLKSIAKPATAATAVIVTSTAKKKRTKKRKKKNKGNQGKDGGDCPGDSTADTHSDSDGSGHSHSHDDQAPMQSTGGSGAAFPEMDVWSQHALSFPTGSDVVQLAFVDEVAIAHIVLFLTTDDGNPIVTVHESHFVVDFTSNGAAVRWACHLLHPVDPAASTSKIVGKVDSGAVTKVQMTMTKLDPLQRWRSVGKAVNAGVLPLVEPSSAAAASDAEFFMRKAMKHAGSTPLPLAVADTVAVVAATPVGRAHRVDDLKHGVYQNDDKVSLELFVKGIDDTSVSIQLSGRDGVIRLASAKAVTADGETFPPKTLLEWHFHVTGNAVADKCTYKVKSTKVEVSLLKSDTCVLWEVSIWAQERALNHRERIICTHV